MRVSEVARWSRRITLLRISTAIIIATSILSAAVMVVTYYGDNIGNYVISLNRESYFGLSLSESSDITTQGDVSLAAEGVKNLNNITYGWIGSTIPYVDASGNIQRDSNIFTSTVGGSHNTYDSNAKGQYLAYTFYLRNAGNAMVNYSLTINLKGSFLNMDEAIRIMVLRPDLVDDVANKQQGIVGIYGRANKSTGEGEVCYQPSNPLHYTAQPFENEEENIVCSKQFSIALGEQHCFTVVMWLEGEDPDCVDSIKGGSIKLDMDFAVQN